MKIESIFVKKVPEIQIQKAAAASRQLLFTKELKTEMFDIKIWELGRH
jgi:hypothetical protein